LEKRSVQCTAVFTQPTCESNDVMFDVFDDAKTEDFYYWRQHSGKSFETRLGYVLKNLKVISWQAAVVFSTGPTATAVERLMQCVLQRGSTAVAENNDPHWCSWRARFQSKRCTLNS